MSEVNDSDIFNSLRKHVEPGKLTQLLVDITNKAMEDDEVRDELIRRLEVVASETIAPSSNSPRAYNLTLSNAQKAYPKFNPAAIELILKLAPQYGIVTKKQMCAYLATCIIESNGYNAKRESFAYNAARLHQVFKARVPTLAKAKALIAQGQVAVANALYGGRYGNRPGTNDGWDYRGGGSIQTTFRSNYYEAQKATGIAFGDNPKLIEVLENAIKASMAYWELHNCNVLAEKINVYSNGYTLNTLNARGVETKNYELNYGARLVRKAVNGGYNGFDEFCVMFEKCMRWL